MYLLHRRLGFPFPKEMYLQPDDERVEAYFSSGRNRIMRPLLRKEIIRDGAVFYQPMFRNGLIDGHISQYDNDYVRSHSLNFNDGVGNIFQEESGAIFERKSGHLFSIKPRTTQEDEKLFIKSAINTYKWQNWLVQFLPKTDRLTSNQRKRVQRRFGAGIKFNKMLIKHHETLL